MSNLKSNLHLNILFLGLVIMFYHYYAFSLSINQMVANDGQLIRAGGLTQMFALAPFTVSSLSCPLGAIALAIWQRRSNSYIFPYLFLADSSLNLLSCFMLQNSSSAYFLQLAMLSRMIQGGIMGGMVTQFILFLDANSSSLRTRVTYSSLFFIVFYLSVMSSLILLNFVAKPVFATVNWYIAYLYLLLAVTILSYRKMWHNFSIAGRLTRHSWSLAKSWQQNHWTIVRFGLFITFMASINAFFLTVMPFFLIHYLHYPAKPVFMMQTEIMLCGIAGFILGGYFHASIGRKTHLTLGIILKVLLLILFKLYFLHDLWLVTAVGGSCLVCFGVMAAKILLNIASIFPVRSRLYGISLIYSLSWGLMFGFSGYITIDLIRIFHNLYSPSLLILFFSYLSLISLWFTPDKDFYRYLKPAQRDAADAGA